MIVYIDGFSIGLICTLSKFVGEEISFSWVYLDCSYKSITWCMYSLQEKS